MVIGRIAVQYTGHRPECNERKCQRTSTAPLALTYFLPQYLLHRYLTLTMHYTPLDGPTLALRAPRVTPWSHLYWNYSNKGDLAAIQKMFARHKASPFDLNLRGSNALMYAANHKDYRISHFLIKQGADPNVPNATGRVPSELLFDSFFAGRFGDEGISIVRSMFKDIDYMATRGFSNIHKIVLGIIRNDLRAELEISTAGINIGDARGRTPLAWAVIRDDSRGVEILLAFGADPNIVDDSGDSPLTFVKSSEICKVLLEAQINIHLRSTDYQRTALHRLCLGHGTVKIVDLLVNAGIAVDVLDADHETPLLNAVFGNLTATAERLIELGANVNAANISSRDNSIHFAVSHGHYQIIARLLANDVDYAATNIRGRNIGHMAAMLADTDTINTLAESKLIGLDLSLKDLDGKTPADHLAEREIFAESEIGIHEAFEAFVKSVSLPSN